MRKGSPGHRRQLPARRKLRLRAGLLLGSIFLLLAACSRPLPPLRADAPQAALREHQQDLLATASELGADPRRNDARLELVESLRLHQPFAGGWLLLDEFQRRQTLYWLPADGTPLPLIAADSLQLAAVIEQPESGPARQHMLLLARDAASDRLVQLNLKGRQRLLDEGPAGSFSLRGIPPVDLVVAGREPSRLFREGPGSWRLEQSRELMQDRKGWRLGPARELASPYRSLHHFLDAARRGKWRKARRWTDPERLFALPDGGFSPHFRQSLELTCPELLERDRLLKAPPRGPFSTLEDLSGRNRWRVRFDRMPGGEGERWVITGLERVVN